MKSKRAVNLLILGVAVLVFLVSFTKLITIMHEYHRGDTEYHKLIEGYAEDAFPSEEDTRETGVEGQVSIPRNPIDFKGLKQINEDVIGWVNIEATGSSYPITQGDDNSYYLTHTFQKTNNIAGCIFMDCENSKDFTDKNTVIYGHNMKSGSMFGGLRKFKEQKETFDKSHYFWIYAPGKVYKYEIFSCREVPATDKSYQITFNSDDDFLNYVNTCMDNSFIKHALPITENDLVVTLSTCTWRSDLRLIVQGKLIESYNTLD